MGCEGITIGSAYDCENPLVAGVNQRLILINKDDWDDATVSYDVTITSLITDVVLAVGEQGYAFEGVRQSLKPQSAFIPQTVSVGYDHQTDFIVFDISQTQKDNLEEMGLNKFVAVVQNVNVPGNADSVFEVFGAAVGMELLTNTRINDDTETGAGFVISLKTSDAGGKEPKLPTSWWDTDFATTKAKVDALLIPAV